MKSTVILVLLFLVGGTTAFGQITVVTGKDDKGQLIQPNVVFGRQEMTKPTQVPGILPNEPMTFLFHSTKEFVRRDENFTVSLVSMVNMPETTIIDFNGKICKAGIDGEWSGSKRSGCADFYPNISFAGFKKGLTAGEPIKIYTGSFGREYLNGKSLISVKVWSAGLLVQEASVEIFLMDTGTVPRPYYISKVEVSPDGHSLTATGRFRVGAPYYYFVGVLEYGYVTSSTNPMYAAYSTDGVTLRIPVRVWFLRATSEDVAIMTPGDPALAKPNAFVEAAFVPPA